MYVVCCVLPDARCLLCVVCPVLFAVCRLLLVVSRALIVVSLCVVRFAVLCVVRC